MLILLSADIRGEATASAPFLKSFSPLANEVSTGADDGTFDATADTFDASGYGLKFGDDGGNKHHAFFAFGFFGLPPENTVHAAVVDIVPEGYLPTTLPAGARLHAVASANPATPTTIGEAEALLTNLTTAYHEFNDEEIDGRVQFDVKAIIDELRAISGFSSTSPILFVCKANTATGWSSFEATDGGIWGPHLFVQYTAPRTITAGADAAASLASSDISAGRALSVSAVAEGSLDAADGSAGYLYTCEANVAAELLDAAGVYLGQLIPAAANIVADTAARVAWLFRKIYISATIPAPLSSTDIAGWREVNLSSNFPFDVSSADIRISGALGVEAYANVSLGASRIAVYIPPRSVFSHPNGEVNFTRHPRRSFAALEIVQPSQETAAGVPIVGDVVYRENRLQVTWPGMKPSEYTALLAFWKSVVKGSAEAFDYLAISQMLRVRFAPGEAIKMREKAVDSFEVGITLMVEQ